MVIDIGSFVAGIVFGFLLLITIGAIAEEINKRT